MPVTPQGVEAERLFDLAAEKFKEDVLWVLTTQGPTRPSLLHPYLRMVPGYSRDIVREAMWRLLDDKKIGLASDRSLELILVEDS